MRNWRIGSITAGVFLISIGILWFLQNFLPIPYMKILLNSWPIACILIGVEILVFHLIRKEESLRFHGFSIFLLIIVVFTSILFNFGHQLIKEFGMSMESTKIEVNDEQSIPSTIQEIVIDVEDGEINLIGTDTAMLKVNGSIQIPKKDDSKNKLSDYYSIKTIGNTIYVECIQKNVQFFNLDHSQSKINIELPQSMITKIKANNGSVDIRNKSNKTEVDLNDGDLAIEKLSGILVAKSENGSITLNDANLSNQSKLTTDDGNIEVENITGYLNGKVDNGSISVNHANLLKNSEINTENGDITIENISGFIDTSTSNGMTNISHTNIKGKSEFITNDGDIRIVDFKGEIQLKSRNGSITLDEVYFTGNSKVISEDGNIEIDSLKNKDLFIKAKKEDGTIDGSIKWDHAGKNQKQAVLGLGTNQLLLKTMNGSISVSN